MATLPRLRRQVQAAEGRLRVELTRVRRASAALQCHYRRRPTRALLAALGVGWVAGRWLSPAVLAAAVLRLAGGELLLFGRRTVRRLWV